MELAGEKKLKAGISLFVKQPCNWQMKFYGVDGKIQDSTMHNFWKEIYAQNDEMHKKSAFLLTKFNFFNYNENVNILKNRR